MNQNTRNFVGIIPKRAGYKKSQLESSLAFKVVGPLSNITLANEMMEVNHQDSDMKLFSDIIKRNCNRITQLIIDTRMNEMSFTFVEK